MKIDELHVQVNADMSVSEDTVKRCLKLIEWWLSDNPDKRIVGGYRGPDDKIEELRIESRATETTTMERIQ